MAPHLLGAAVPPRPVIGDKTYGAESRRRWLTTRGTKAVIPAYATRRTPDRRDKLASARGILAERLVARLKNRRRIATRDDRLARNDLAALALDASVSEWTR